MIVVEVLTRRGDVARQARFDRLPVTIGRAWSSDVVLDDPTVDAAHARISATGEGTIVLEDLGSVNGMHEGSSRLKVQRIALGGVTTVRLGRTRLRVARSDLAVPPAVPDLAPAGRLAALLASPWRMALVHAVGIALIVLEAMLTSYDPKAGAGTAGRAAAAVVAVAAWAGIWSLVGRIRTQQFMFWQHSTLTWLAVIVVAVIEDLQLLLQFLWPSQGTIAALGGFATACVIVALMTTQLGLVSTARRSYRFGLATAIVIVVGWLGVLADKAATNDFDAGTVSLSTTLTPLPVPLIPSQNVDDFLKSTEGLKKAVDSRIP